MLLAIDGDVGSVAISGRQSEFFAFKPRIDRVNLRARILNSTC